MIISCELCFYLILEQSGNYSWYWLFITADWMPSGEATRKDKGEKVKFIGSYKLGHTLGKGSFCKVKLATHELSGQKVFITPTMWITWIILKYKE